MSLVDFDKYLVMNRHFSAFATCCLLVFFCVAAGTSSAAERKTNFLVIMADDLGFSDLGCYGGEIKTPNLDALAEKGLRFTQFYNTSRCWPTRAALMTGFYPQQIRKDGMPGAPRDFGGLGKRPEWAQTIAEYLRPAGYRTYHSGKWHIDGDPLKNGFDRSDQTSRGSGFFDSLKRKDRDPKYYRTTATAQHAIDCLKEHADKFSDKAFFQYVAFHAPHFPLHALPEDIARYNDRYLTGWDILRKERHQRQKEMGMDVGELSELEPCLGPPYDFPDSISKLGDGEITRPLPWKNLTDAQKPFQAEKMAIHAAMIDRMDQEIGRILSELEKMDVLEDTFICFLSDNGASAEIMVRGDGHDPTAPMGSAATYLCLGPGFSSAANTPFRRHKTWVHEGGVSTPFIVHWPKGIKARNEFRSTVGHVIDLAPTIMDIAGVKRDVSDGPAMSGRSLRWALMKEGATVHEELWFYHQGSRALRQGDWKIIHSVGTRPYPWRPSPDEATAKVDWALYDLNRDRAEENDLSKKHPKRVKDMVARWTELSKQFFDEAMGRSR